MKSLLEEAEGHAFDFEVNLVVKRDEYDHKSQVIQHLQASVREVTSLAKGRDEVVRRMTQQLAE